MNALYQATYSCRNCSRRVDISFLYGTPAPTTTTCTYCGVWGARKVWMGNPSTSITKAAKEILKRSDGKQRYIEAVDQVVSESVEVAEQNIKDAIEAIS